MAAKTVELLGGVEGGFMHRADQHFRKSVRRYWSDRFLDRPLQCSVLLFGSAELLLWLTDVMNPPSPPPTIQRLSQLSHSKTSRFLMPDAIPGVVLPGFTRTSVYEKDSGSRKGTTHLDYTSHCRASPGIK